MFVISFYRTPWQNETVALTTHMEEVNNVVNRNTETICTLSDANGPIGHTHELSSLRPYDGIMHFYVNQMNVQGGGILSHSCGTNIHNGSSDAFSMKWTSSVSEIEGEIDTSHSGCWYFDLEQKTCNLTEIVNDLEVQQLRMDFVRSIEDNKDHMLNRHGFWGILCDMLDGRIKQGVSENLLKDIAPFQKGLLSVPFLTYQQVMLRYFQIFNNETGDDTLGLSDLLSSKDWCLVFFSLIKVAIHLRGDKEWHNSNQRFQDWYVVFSANEFASQSVEQWMETVLYNLTTKTAEWFETVQEYRAAIWCYKLNLDTEKSLSNVNDDNEIKDYMASLLGYIALANKRMDNFVEASRYYEEAILLTERVRQPGVPLRAVIKNAKSMQEVSKNWYGTDGCITGWKSSACDDASRSMKCSSCQAEGAAKKCSACRLAIYCSSGCQKDHWSKVHKHTCLGKLRGK